MTTISSPPKSPAEMFEERKAKNTRTIRVLLLLFVVSVVATGIEILAQGVPERSLGDTIIIFTLLNINIILLLALGIFVGRNVVKLYYERRQDVLGSKFRTKLVLTFVVLILIPTSGLFIVGTGMINAIVNNWFSPPVERSLRDAVELAHSLYYEEARKRAAGAGSRIADEIAREELLALGAEGRLSTLLSRKLRDENMARIEVRTSPAVTRLNVAGPGLPEEAVRPPAPEAVESGFRGEAVSDIVATPAGEIVRAVVPIAAKGGRVPGIVIADVYFPPALVSKLGSISTAYDEYRQLQAYRTPIKASYLVTFLLVTLAILFIAIWYGLYLSKGITIPIQKLAEATHRVSQGDLDVKVDAAAADEIGTLVDSFNKMTEDIRTGRERLDAAYRSLQVSAMEIDARRAYTETILENVAAGVVSVDITSKVTTFNRAAGEILGIDPAQIVGRPYREVLSEGDFRPVLDLVRSLSEGGRRTVEKNLTLAIGGRILHLHMAVSRLVDSRNEPLGFLVLFEDLTELIKAQKTATWEEVARRIAHEIKNPLTPIRLSAQRLRRRFSEGAGDFPSVLEECTRTIVQQVDDLKRLVDEFSQFARFPVARPQPNDLNGLIGEVAALYRSAHRDVAIETELDPGVTIFSFDKEQFRRLFVNLFENAVQAMDGRGRLVVRTRVHAAEGKVTVEVADNGPGIPSEEMDKIFLPYFSRKKSGTGLGLAIVNRIVSEHAGQIRVARGEPQGTTFMIDLPLKAA